METTQRMKEILDEKRIMREKLGRMGREEDLAPRSKLSNLKF